MADEQANCAHCNELPTTVFVQSPATEFAPTNTFDDLTGREHLFSPHTHACVRCGQSAEHAAIENLACPGR